MRIFFAGLITETNTFSPIPTGLDDFHVIRPGDPVPTFFAGLVNEVEQRCREDGHELVRGAVSYAQPAGLTVRSAYESLRDELLDDLRKAGHVDVVLLLLHGAMVADGYECCETDLTARVRAIVGDDAVIGVELDLHCHVEQHLLDVADVIVAFKEYPHVDIADRLREVFTICVDAAAGRIKPVMALYECRMVGSYSTFREPMRSFVDEMKAAETRAGVLSVSHCHGFPWGDVAHGGARILAVTDGDAGLAARIAEEFGRKIFALRHQAGIVSLSLEEALSKAVTSRRPTVVADQSDNAGGGAPGDSTFALRWLLDHGVTNAGVAIIYDPEVVKIAKAAGAGASLQVRLGGKTSALSGDPLDLQVTVRGVQRDYSHEFPQQGGTSLSVPLGDVAALECHGIFIIVASRRSQCYSPKIFHDFGIDGLDIYVPKSTNHFLSGFGPMAGEVIYMAGPGAIPPVMTQIPYRKLDTRNLYPWVDDPFANPVVPDR